MRRTQMAKRGLRYGYGGYGYRFNIIPAVTLVAIIALFIAVQGVINNLSDREIRAKYQTIEHHISGVKIVNGNPNVRSEPINQDISDMSNSYGKADIDAEISVSTLYSTDVILDANGSYYGLKTEEILTTPEGKAAFPKSIKKDQDGIVWINSDYLEIYD